MKSAPFDYRAPESLDQALQEMEQYGDEAKVLAGGQSLVPLLALRLARPTVLVDLGRVPGLSTISSHGGALTVGAMVTESAVERSGAVVLSAPLLTQAVALIGHPAIRSRGTVGGSLAHADPAAELPAVAVALRATMVAQSVRRARREIPAAAFFQGYFTTALEPDEILTEVRVQESAPGTGVSFEEVSRRHGDFAMVGVAALLTMEGERIGDARLVLTGVGDGPIRATAAEASLIGAPPTSPTFRDAAELARSDLRPVSDLHASSGYRRHVAGVLVHRALRRAALGAAAGAPARRAGS